MNGTKPKSQKQVLAEFIRKVVRDEIDRKMAAMYKDLKIELLEYMVRGGNVNAPVQHIQEQSIPQYDSEGSSDLRRVMKNLNSMPGRAEVAKMIVTEPPRQYSKDPLLNEMLSTSMPHQDDTVQDSVLDATGGFIVGVENKVVDANNPTVRKVLNNMNRDYRSMLKLTEQKVNAQRGALER